MVGLWGWASIFPCSCHPGPHLVLCIQRRHICFSKTKPCLGEVGWRAQWQRACLAWVRPWFFPAQQNKTEAMTFTFCSSAGSGWAAAPKTACGGKGLSGLRVQIKGVHGGSSGQGLSLGAALCLVLHGSMVFSYSPGPGVALPTMEWALTHLSLIKKMLRRHTQRYIQTSDAGSSSIS